MTFKIGGITFYPFTGFTPTSDRNTLNLEKDNSQQLGGLLTEEQISGADLLSGVYDGARVTCFLVDMTDLPYSILMPPPPKFLTLYKRYIKISSQNDLAFSLELQDNDWKLDAKIGKQTSKFCGHDLGDANCGVDLTPYTFNEAIAQVINRYQFETTGSYVPEQFSRGSITFNTGLNAGITRDIATFGLQNSFTLWQPVPYSIAVGDEVTIVQGCSKTLFDCVTRYDNAINCDSEPHIPTTDQAINTPISS